MSIRFVKYFISFSRHYFFWGDNAYDNYGFGNSDISGNIDGVTSQLNNSGFGNRQCDGGNNAITQSNNNLQILQCELAKISPSSRDWGLRLGYAKEVWDYHKKKGNMPMSAISEDSQKDLKNNFYGSNLGYYNQNKGCEDLLDDRRTPNMRKTNIR